MILNDGMSVSKKPSLFSAMAIGVGCIIGSGWLFASYKASHYAGPIAVFSWIIGAFLALLIALLLAEIATIYYNQTGLFARLLSLTHNSDYGFIVSSSNWFATIITIPSEAEASLQYLANTFDPSGSSIFINGEFTRQGILYVCLLMVGYGLLNYWGIKLLSRANNVITTLKVIIPTLTAIIIIMAAFHPVNFVAYHNTIAPYGVHRVFGAVVSCGIFYSFYGFSMITIFARELDNPQRNIPVALGGAILLCLLIYLLLQVAFIGAIDPHTVIVHGWHSLHFDSPLAQLAALLGINWLVLVLYVDAAFSPSGTAIIYVGSSARMFSGMSEDGHMPRVFANEHPLYGVSRLAIILTIVFCMVLVVFFNNWDKIMIIVSVFQLVSCLAVPIAYVKLKKDYPLVQRSFVMPYGRAGSFITYLIVTYLLIQCGILPLLMSLIFHLVFFIIYCMTYYRSIAKMWLAFRSAWSLFAYMFLITACGYLQSHQMLEHTIPSVIMSVGFIILYKLLIDQKSYN